jgi:replicative DNA helicase
MTEPHDLLAERAVVGSCLAAGQVPEGVTAVLSPSDVYDPHLQQIAEACWDGFCDPIQARTELLRRGVRGQATDGVFLAGLMSEGQPVMALHYARIVRDLSVRRQVIVEATRAVQAAENPATDPYDVAASLSVQAGVLSDRIVVRKAQLTDVHRFLEGPTEFDWLVPGLLERGDRLLLTAGEGNGKSVMTRQIAVMVAAGLHPFTARQLSPLPVLLVDLENGTRHLRRALKPLLEQAWRDGRPVPEGGLVVESRPSGIDLTKPDDEAWLFDLCDQAKPALLVIGPLYRMHATDMAKEEPARHLTRVLDAIRSRHDCSIVVETHAPHGSAVGPRSLRPVGSSLFLRWPEFGYGIAPAKEDGVFYLRSWRGARDERDWPSRLAWGGAGRWPWVVYSGNRNDWQEESA